MRWGLPRQGLPQPGPQAPAQSCWRRAVRAFFWARCTAIALMPAARFGKPCVRGTRLTVGDVLGTLAAGSTEAELLEDFPQLTHEDVLACRCLTQCHGPAAPVG